MVIQKKARKGLTGKGLMQELAQFRQLWSGFQASRVVLTANNLRVFDLLAKDRTAADVARALRADTRAIEILLDAVTSLGLLRKTGRTYRNTALSANFLVKESPVYQGDMLRHADSLWISWSGLDEVVRTGNPSRGRGRDHDAFIRAMHNNSVMTARGIVNGLDLRGVRRILDLGGGPGTYSIEFARKGLDVTLFDVPETLSIARDIMAKAEVHGVQLRGGDFHCDDIGADYDLVLMSQILHSQAPNDIVALLKRVRVSLNAKGTAVIHEFALEENRAAPPSGALFSINMLVNTPGGRSYTPNEMKGWLRKAGFGPAKVKRLANTVLIKARKK